MTGGYTMIPILGRDDEKIEIASTSKNIKLGTFAKMKRAIALNKSCVLTEVFFADMKIVPGSAVYGTVALTGGGEAAIVLFFIPQANGGYIARVVHITSSDTIYFTIN